METHMFCIILADRPNGSCKRTFLKPGLRVEKCENAARAFSFGRWIPILCESITPSPHPSTSPLWPLNPVTTTTTTMADYMLVFVPQKILSLSGLIGQNIYAPLPLCWVKKDYGQPTSHFLLLLLLVFCLFLYSVQALCACSVSSSLFLVNFKRHLGLEYELVKVLSRL